MRHHGRLRQQSLVNQGSSHVGSKGEEIPITSKKYPCRHPKASQRARNRKRNLARRNQFDPTRSPTLPIPTVPGLPSLLAMCATLDGIRASLMDPQALFSQPSGKVKNSLVIWDSGASLSLSFNRDDFIGELKKPSEKYKLKGIARGLDIEGIGHVVFTIRDYTGMLRSLKTKVLYCPKATVKLLSTISLLQEYDESISLTSNQLILSGNHGSERHHRADRSSEQPTYLPPNLSATQVSTTRYPALSTQPSKLQARPGAIKTLHQLKRNG
jgi:hypothetical protein